MKKITLVPLLMDFINYKYIISFLMIIIFLYKSLYKTNEKTDRTYPDKAHMIILYFIIMICSTIEFFSKIKVLTVMIFM